MSLDDYLNDEYLIDQALRKMPPVVAASATLQLITVARLLSRHPELDYAEVMKLEGFARAAEDDPTAPAFIAAWRARLLRNRAEGITTE